MQSIADDLRVALDPSQLMRSIGFEPDDWQGEFLRSDEKRILLNCCRQSGKSTVTSSLALHTALYKPGALVLLLSPSLRQSLELYAKVREGYAKLGFADDGLATVLKLINGSRIVSLPGSEKTVRGFSSVDLLICDEAARVEDNLFYAVSPMQAVSNGRLIMLSTPFGQRGVFFDLWQNSDYLKVKIDANQCPRITKDFLANEKKTLPDRVFRQEYYCEFLQTDDAVFNFEDVNGLISDEIEPLFKIK